MKPLNINDGNTAITAEGGMFSLIFTDFFFVEEWEFFKILDSLYIPGMDPRFFPLVAI